MAWSLPPNLQPCDRTADCLARDPDVVMILQMLPQEGGGPDRRMVAELTRVGVDDLGDQGIDVAVTRSGTTRARGVGETSSQVESGAFL
jgi:hypothetical protein